MKAGIALFLLAGHLFSANVYADHSQVIDLNPRPDVSMDYLFLPSHGQAIANVILFAGGSGKLKFDNAWLAQKGNNFLVRSRELFRQRSINTAVFNAPSDMRGRQGMKGGKRTSDRHLTDIRTLVDDLRSRSALPVWLVGTSRGTESVAWAAIHLDGLAGIVLTASMSEENGNGYSLPEMPLHKIKVPVLIAAHREDDCFVTPPYGAETIAQAMRQSRKTKLLFFEGGLPAESDACKGLSPHGFYGIEEKVIESIHRFITSTL